MGVIGSKQSLEVHKRVIKALRFYGRRARPAVRVGELAKRTGSDRRTVKYHLEIMAADRQVIFLDPEETLVACVSDLNRVVEDMKAKVEREELLYASASSGASLVWGDEK